MKKILLAFDGDHFPESSLQFVRQLKEEDSVFLIGAFLPQMQLASLWSLSGGGLSGGAFVPLVEEEDANELVRNIKRFEAFCYSSRIDFQVHKDYFDLAIPSLTKESGFADLMIISSEVFYKEAGSARRNRYLEDILHLTKCPVIIVPEVFEFPRRNILAYDGSESSIYAIEQFAYLFPYLTKNKTLLVHVPSKNKDRLPEEANIRQLVSQQFSDAQFLLLENRSKEAFTDWCWDMDKAILVCGGYGRSGLSLLFRKSFIAGIISDHRLPVFVAHR